MWGNPMYGPQYGPGQGGPVFQLPPNTTFKDFERLMKILDKVSTKKEEAEKKKSPPKKEGGGFTAGQAFMFFCFISPIVGISSAYMAINAITEMLVKLSNLPH